MFYLELKNIGNLLGLLVSSLRFSQKTIGFHLIQFPKIIGIFIGSNTISSPMLQNVLLPREIYASEEHSMMREMIQEFIHNEILPHTDEWEKNGMVSREIWERAGELGLLCIDMPEQYGGSGLDFSFNDALDKNSVSEDTKKDVLAILWSLKDTIIAK